MKQKNVLVLSVVTLGALVLTAVALRAKDDSGSKPAGKRLLFPELGAHINDVVEIQLEKGGKSATVKRESGQWKLSDRGGYPALFEKVKELAVRLADLGIEEEKTAKKENHKKLAVEWPTTAAEGSEAGEAGLVTLKDSGGKVLAALVVGKSEYQGSKPKVFVRRLGEDQVYKVAPSGALDVVPEAKTWIEPKFVELANDRVQTVSIEHTDGEKIEIARSVTNHTQFAVQNVPPGEHERFDGVATSVAQALGYGLTLDDVRPVTEIDFSKEPLAKTHFHCVDGLELELTLAKLDDKVWLKIAASYTPPPAEPEKPADSADKPADAASSDATKPDADKDKDKDKDKKDVGKEAEELNARLAPWAFQVPSYKTDVLARHMKDLLAEPAPPAGSANGGDGGLDAAMDQMGAGDETLEPAPKPDDEGKAPPADAPPGEKKPH